MPLKLHHRGNASSLGAGPGHNMGLGVVPDPFLGREVTSAKGDHACLYILLIKIFYTCLAGGLILAYTHSLSGSLKPRMSHPNPTPNTTSWPPQPNCWLKAAAHPCPEHPGGLEPQQQLAHAFIISLILGAVLDFSFPHLPGFASPEAQTVMRDQETFSGRSTTLPLPASFSLFSLLSPMPPPNPTHPTAINCLYSLVFRKPVLQPSGD